MKPNSPIPVEILLIEDNPGDARLAREALKDSKLNSSPPRSWKYLQSKLKS
jgi:hypothetical protein